MAIRALKGETFLKEVIDPRKNKRDWSFHYGYVEVTVGESVTISGSKMGSVVVGRRTHVVYYQVSPDLHDAAKAVDALDARASAELSAILDTPDSAGVAGDWLEERGIDRNIASCLIGSDRTEPRRGVFKHRFVAGDRVRGPRYYGDNVEDKYVVKSINAKSVTLTDPLGRTSLETFYDFLRSNCTTYFVPDQE